MKKYIIFEKKEKRNTAGAKAPSDIYRICKKLGYDEILMPKLPPKKNKVFQKLWLLIVGFSNWMKLLIKIEKNSMIVYQHPMYGNRLIKVFIPIIKKIKKAKFVVVIHDLESLRGGISGVVERSKTTNDIADNVLLKEFDAIICHNAHMKEYLISKGFNAKKIINLEIFDYLTEKNESKKGKGITPSIAIAGTLAISKVAYIYKVYDNNKNQNLVTNLYGMFYEEKYAHKNMIYHGSFKPDELSKELTADFGLVWDGNSANTCSGNTGDYLRYNNPHKTSLFLASGIPVIVWKQAAIADFILENKVGFVIDSLEEIEEKITNISNEEYLTFINNVEIVGSKIRNGYYIGSALQKAEKLLI